MLHKINEYKTDRIIKCKILKITGVIMKGHNDFTEQLLLTLVKQSFKIQVATVTKKIMRQCIE